MARATALRRLTSLSGPDAVLSMAMRFWNEAPELPFTPWVDFTRFHSCGWSRETNVTSPASGGWAREANGTAPRLEQLGAGRVARDVPEHPAVEVRAAPAAPVILELRQP